MSRCENPDEFVTDQYVRVSPPNEMNTIQVYSNCPDLLRVGAEVREASFAHHING